MAVTVYGLIPVCWLIVVALGFVIWIAYEIVHAPVVDDDGHIAEDKDDGHIADDKTES